MNQINHIYIKYAEQNLLLYIYKNICVIRWDKISVTYHFFFLHIIYFLL